MLPLVQLCSSSPEPVASAEPEERSETGTGACCPEATTLVSLKQDKLVQMEGKGKGGKCRQTKQQSYLSSGSIGTAAPPEQAKPM